MHLGSLIQQTREDNMELLTVSEIAILNTARTILHELEDRASKASHGDEGSLSLHDAWSLGRVAEAADHADNGIFMALNNLNTYSPQRLTEAQLHNN
jgi:hypothetical protein